MATITLRLDDWTRNEIERLARAHGMTISELVRSKIDELLGKDVEVGQQNAPRSLDIVQRRTLALQHEILALLASDEDDAKHHRRRVQVLEEGFTAEYSDEFIATGPELGLSECSLVWDILDMFSVLENSVAQLNTDDIAALGEDAARRLSFRGFDGNNARESRLLGYTRYLIQTERWEDLADHLSAAQQRGNSHAPMLATYQRMHKAFEPIWKNKQSRGGRPEDYYFNVDELRQVLDAWRY